MQISETDISTLLHPAPPEGKIPITLPVFGPEELAAVQRPLEAGWVVQGPYVREFEERFAAFVGAAHASATTSCTTALHICTTAFNVRPGDEVIVPAFTWISTANVVEFLGGKAVFCDVDLDTFNLDPTRLEALVTDRTVGIIPVHLFGLAADMDPIMDVAKRHGLWVLEDAACGFGATYHGRHVGTIGEAGCFSFHPRKSITTGEGGMITTNDDELGRLAGILRDHGASRTDHERHHGKAAFLLAEYHHLGYNFRMTDLQGALGCAQMDRAPWIIERRTALAARYDALLADIEWLRAPAVPEGYTHGYQAYVCLFRPDEPTLENVDRLNAQRNDLLMQLEAEGISTRQGTHAPVLLDLYAKKYGLRAEDFPNATLADRLTLTLPLYPQMTEAAQDRVVARLRALAPTR